jgi:flagellar motility protein MotE (MotC chaperone)
MKKTSFASSQDRAPVKSLFPHLTYLRKFVIGAMFVLVLMLGARVVDVAEQLATGRAMPGISPLMAEPDKTEAKPEEAKPADTTDVKRDDTAAAKKDEAAPAAPHVETPTMDEPENYSDAEIAILRKLSDRRQELEKRAREFDQREALMRVTEQRVDKKIADLNALKEEIRKIVGDATETQKVQAASLVKIYETMKPKEAAAIFENLDMPVLINVVRRMKETKVAPILGSMDPLKAKELTSALMEKKELPQLPK